MFKNQLLIKPTKQTKNKTKQKTNKYKTNNTKQTKQIYIQK